LSHFQGKVNQQVKRVEKGIHDIRDKLYNKEYATMDQAVK